MMNLDLSARLDAIPDHDHFPSPDELDDQLTQLTARYPDLVRRERVGVSQEGAPIHLVSVGSGPRRALVFAGPHPNEPIGFLTVPYLARLLCEDDALRQELGYTWHFVGCVDPDGARLNSGWYRGPFTRTAYSRHMYRPPLNQQVEWTFPSTDEPGFADRVMPETRALMRVIDTVRPHFMTSLHNGEFGGSFYYITHDDLDLAEALSGLAEPTGIPLHTGDAELPGARRLAPGVFRAPTHQDVQQAVLARSDAADTWRLDASSLDYASRHDTCSLVIEVPLWSDSRSGDGTGCGERHADVLRDAADLLAEISPHIGQLIDPAVATAASPFARSLTDIRHTATGLAGALREHASQVGEAEATVAQRFQLRQMAHMLRLRGAGTALRLLDEPDSGQAPNVRDAVDALFETWSSAAEEDAVGTLIPLSRLLGAQLAAILTTANHLATRDGDQSRR